MSISAAPLWGLARTARTEHPDLHLRLVDIDNGTDTSDALLQALNLNEEPECAIRSGRVLVPRLQRSVYPLRSALRMISSLNGHFFAQTAPC